MPRLPIEVLQESAPGTNGASQRWIETGNGENIKAWWLSNFSGWVYDTIGIAGKTTDLADVSFYVESEGPAGDVVLKAAIRPDPDTASLFTYTFIEQTVSLPAAGNVAKVTFTDVPCTGLEADSRLILRLERDLYNPADTLGITDGVYVYGISDGSLVKEAGETEVTQAVLESKDLTTSNGSSWVTKISDTVTLVEGEYEVLVSYGCNSDKDIKFMSSLTIDGVELTQAMPNLHKVTLKDNKDGNVNGTGSDQENRFAFVGSTSIAGGATPIELRFKQESGNKPVSMWDAIIIIREL